MKVRVRAFYGEFSIRELEGLDFDAAGDDTDNGIAVMNAIYAVAKEIPVSR